MESPERVRRVSPPRTTILPTHAVHNPSQAASARRIPSLSPSASLGWITCKEIQQVWRCVNQWLAAATSAVPYEMSLQSYDSQSRRGQSPDCVAVEDKLRWQELKRQLKG